MKKNINTQLSYYFVILSFFGIFFLFQKHNTGNDSTISEWLINYSGGFTKRGIIGQISVLVSPIFDFNLRDSILFFQILIFITYFISLYFFLKDILINNLLLLAIFTPIFILYPIAEIEVLARKELFIFCFYIFYLNISNKNLRIIYKIICLPIAVLIWEPVIFFFPFWLATDMIKNNYLKFKDIIFKSLPSFLPSILIALYIAINPITPEAHLQMENFLKINFNENCYMSCGLLLSKSTIYEQFEHNFNKYSLEIFIRYFLIILIGFGPLFILSFYSKLKNTKLFFFKNFKNILWPLLLILQPVLILFAMGYDWGRWVNISYVFSFLFFLDLYKKKFLILDLSRCSIEKIFQKNRKTFLFIFILFCFGWNPKTVITGDVASFPGYRIPYKAFKIINLNYIK